MTEEQSTLVSTFMEITGSDLKTASFAMEASAYDLESAVNLHEVMSSGGGGLAFAPPTDITDSDLDGKKRTTSELASFGDEFDEGGVRKADEVKRQRLLDMSPKGYLRHDPSLPSNIKDSVFFGSDDGKLKGKSKALNQMFAPPRDLMVSQPLHSVQQMCDEQKWLLVNIQRVDEFHCLELNRDVWADETVKEVLRSSFLFWQQIFTDYDTKNHMHRKTDAQDFVQKYRVDTYPHISIIDPRTGAMIWKWDEQKSNKQKKSGDTRVHKEHFLERIMDFIGENPHPKGFTGLKRPEAAFKAVGGIDDDTPRFGGSAPETGSNSSSVTSAPLNLARSMSSSESSLSLHDPHSRGGAAPQSSSPRGTLRSEVKDETEPTELRENIKGQGYHIFTVLRFKDGADDLDEKRLLEGGAIRVKLQLPGTAARLALAEDTSALELVMFVAKRLRDEARAASSSDGADKDAPSSLQTLPRFELSFGMPAVRLSEKAGENEAELGAVTVTSLGLRSGDLVRLQRLEPLR